MHLRIILAAAALAAALGPTTASEAGAATAVLSDAAAFKAASSALATVDFNGVVPDNSIEVKTGSITVDGVDFSALSPIFIDVRGPQLSDDQGNPFAAGSAFGSAYLTWEQFGRLTITLPYAVRSIGFNYINLFGFEDSWSIEAGGEFFTGGSAGNSEFFGLVSDTPFSTISIADEEGFAAIDNLSFDVPEPATLAIFGLAFAGMSLTRRRAASLTVRELRGSRLAGR